MFFLFQVEKVLTGYPASYGGLKVHDFLISVNGQEVFEMNHGQLVKLIKTSGNTMELAVERWSKVYLIWEFQAVIWNCPRNVQESVTEIVPKIVC